MAFDYTKPAATALRLIKSTGRVVSFLRFDQTPADPNKPYTGPASPKATPDASASLSATFVPPSGVTQLGLEAIDQDLLKRTAEVALVAPESDTFDLTTASVIVDGGKSRKVSFVRVLKPADIVVLYVVGVES